MTASVQWTKLSFLSFAMATALISCSSSPSSSENTLKQFEETQKYYAEYIDTLLTFESSNPQDWLTAEQKLRTIQYRPRPRDEDDLLSQLHSTPERADKARRELARRGKIQKLLTTYNKLDPAQWAEARKQLEQLGPDAVTILIDQVLVPMFSNAAFQSAWPLVRQELVTLGEPALQLISALAVRRAQDPKVKIAGSSAEIALTQYSAVLVLFGNKGKETLERLTHDPRWQVRKAVAAAYAEAGQALDCSLLARLLSDSEWQVRAKAAEALGTIPSAKSQELLNAALDREQDSFVLEQISGALTKIRRAKK